MMPWVWISTSQMTTNHTWVPIDLTSVAPRRNKESSKDGNNASQSLVGKEPEKYSGAQPLYPENGDHRHQSYRLKRVGHGAP